MKAKTIDDDVSNAPMAAFTDHAVLYRKLAFDRTTCLSDSLICSCLVQPTRVGWGNRAVPTRRGTPDLTESHRTGWKVGIGTGHGERQACERAQDMKTNVTG